MTQMLVYPSKNTYSVQVNNEMSDQIGISAMLQKEVPSLWKRALPLLTQTAFQSRIFAAEFKAIAMLGHPAT